jgi:hypothetical protein
MTKNRDILKMPSSCISFFHDFLVKFSLVPKLYLGTHLFLAKLYFAPIQNWCDLVKVVFD